ncbi:mitochondrial RNA polymerase specificity factor [Candida orthopsilosis Co 90-125]|uniref:rRNA adenine N(6)-methyltransferase n=1 Tax=Candida orthopsilosis (strain 90-125) TaxID=1136231 RepID=H8WYP0_CANO9|nr:mitochondrial RNA polymerase specificity factor [Candida orthopsilosis Co 90-125]CCG21522.1 mitochondrial RNA polymerase specificity factor [Candida orthopsilosis Co 90-125]
MSTAVNLRSYNPVLKKYFDKLPRFTYGKSQLKNPEACQLLLDKLNLKPQYNSSKLDIIDATPGFGLFSSMLNQELKPRNHILIDRNDETVKSWHRKIQTLQNNTGNKENFKFIDRDPFSWHTYSSLYKKGVIPPTDFQSYDKMHEELLIIANWTGTKDEATIAQWIGCCSYRNWLMKYGKVRMILFVPSVTAMKFLSEPGFRKRNRTALKRDLYTDSKLIGIGQESDVVGEGYDPRVLVRDQPVVIDKSSFIRNSSVAVVEIMPGRYTNDAIANIEHLLSGFFVTSASLGDQLPKLAAGAEYLRNLLPEKILDKRATEFTTDDVLAIADAYEKWPFKPSVEETFDIGDEDFK